VCGLTLALPPKWPAQTNDAAKQSSTRDLSDALISCCDANNSEKEAE